jgi:WD40 repeat protein
MACNLFLLSALAKLHTNMRSFQVGYPVDSLILDSTVIAGSYSCDGEARVGAISVLDTVTGDVLFSRETSGTFNIQKYGNAIFSANASNVAMMSVDGLDVLKDYETNSMNTDLAVAINSLSAATTCGSVRVFDLLLNIIDEHKVSQEMLWSISCYGNVLYTGGDDKQVYEWDLRSKTHRCVVKKSDVVTMVKIWDNLLYVGSYDKGIEVYDTRNYQQLCKRDLGGAWRMGVDGEAIFVACIHDGVKVFDREWNLVESFRTESIVYAVDMHEGVLAFSSFYERKIFLAHISSTLFA